MLVHSLTFACTHSFNEHWWRLILSHVDDNHDGGSLRSLFCVLVDVPLPSCGQLFPTPSTTACQASLSQVHARWISDVIQPSHPLSPSSPPALNLSQQSGSFPMSRFFASGGQSIGTSASASVLPMNIQGWFPLRLTVLISFLSKWLSRVFSNTTQSINSLALSFIAQLSHLYMNIGKTITLTRGTFVIKPVSPKETNAEYSMEGLLLKLKFQYFAHLMRRANSLEKTLILGKTECKKRRGWQRMR